MENARLALEQQRDRAATRLECKISAYQPAGQQPEKRGEEKIVHDTHPARLGGPRNRQRAVDDLL